MVAVPTIEEEDAKRPSRERENLVGEATRIINRMKAALARLGIRGFNPKLRKASQRLELLRTPDALPIPPNTLDEMRRDLGWLAVVREQITAIERARVERLQQAPQTGPHAMVRLLASILGVGIDLLRRLSETLISKPSPMCFRPGLAVARVEPPVPQQKRTQLLAGRAHRPHRCQTGTY